jgi:hypothetical protein
VTWLPKNAHAAIKLPERVAIRPQPQEAAIRLGRRIADHCLPAGDRIRLAPDEEPYALSVGVVATDLVGGRAGRRVPIGGIVQPHGPEMPAS